MDRPDSTVVERVARHDRAMLIGTLVLVTAGCWFWIVPMARDMYGAMTGPSAWMMTDRWDFPHLLLLGAMWIVMMAGMMLPSATPTLLVYAAASRRRAGSAARRSHVYLMATGYLLVWVAFSACAVLLQRALSSLLLLSPMMTVTSPALSGALLIGAGMYQFTPLKHRCLASCSAPMMFLMRRWREGGSGAFRLGLEHGLLCLGCCWALMLLLFAGGVMNLGVIGALTAVVLLEKLARVGERGVRLVGAALVLLGLWVVAR
jgi:predicted metal-binding membrane protein